jgi:hypothetical protein
MKTLKSRETSASTSILQQIVGCLYRGNFARIAGSELASRFRLDPAYTDFETCSPIMSVTPVLGGKTVIKGGIFEDVPKPMFESYTKDRRPFLKAFEGAAQK